MSSAPITRLTPLHIMLILTNNMDYIEVEYKGGTVRQYPDGALRQANGQLVAQHPLAAATITEETSPSLNKRRWDKVRREEQELREEVTRALVSQVAGAKTPAGAIGIWVGHLAHEMDSKTAPKEHGISNYVKVTKEVAVMAGLIEEKKADHRQVNIENINLDADVKDHVERLLSRLLSRAGEGDGV